MKKRKHQMLNMRYLLKRRIMKYSFENYLENRDAELAESLFGKVAGLAKAGAQGLASAGWAGLKGLGRTAYDAAKTGLKSAATSYANRDVDRAKELMGTIDDPHLKQVLQDYLKRGQAAPTGAAPTGDSFTARCPSCTIKLKVKKSLIGKTLNCPNCKELLKIEDSGFKLLSSKPSSKPSSKQSSKPSSKPSYDDSNEDDDSNENDSKDLDQAIKMNNKNIVLHLIKKGTKISNDAVAIAAEQSSIAKDNNFDIVKLLVEKGAKIDSMAIYHASQRGNFDLVKYLVEKGGNIDSGDFKYAATKEIRDYLTKKLQERLNRRHLPSASK